MSPEQVPAELVEKFANALGIAYVAEQMPEYARNLRLGLAAVLPEAMAEAWEEGAASRGMHGDADEPNPYREGSTS